MSDITTVAIDAMGGDNAPAAPVKGAVDAVNARDDIKVILVGNEDVIKKELEAYTYKDGAISIVNATEVIEMSEHPVTAVRKKKDSSMVVALRQVKEGNADAVISGGNSGALLAGGLGIVGRIRGIERSPFGALVPSVKTPFLLVDSGANVDVRSSHLVQFARMGSIYMEYVLGIEKPRVALVNNGAEEEKGNALTKETYPLLKECKDINFIGNIEPREIPNGAADVIVCDGFVGNSILKLYEGLASALIGTIKEGLMSTLKSKIGAALALPALKKTLKRFDSSTYGGAPLLGLNGLVVKVHGSAKSTEFTNALYQCSTFKQQDINGKIKEHIVIEKEEKED